MREYKRLRRSNEQSPGYAMSRAYLETLADLPWSALASQCAAPPAGDASAGNDTAEPVEDGDSAGSNAGSTPQPTKGDDEATALPASIPSTSRGEV